MNHDRPAGATGLVARFLPPDAGAQAGGQFVLQHSPPSGTPLRACVVFAHALAEEMNKSRHVVAQTARALAERGALVLVPDLPGCGDSPQTFDAVHFGDWTAAIQQTAAWARREAPGLPLWFWGHRAGALLAAQAAAKLPDSHLLLWQPATSGKTVLQQFLRLKLAAGLQAEAKGPGARELLDTVGQVEVAGYPLSASLADGLEAARLEVTPSGANRRLVWLEVSTREPAALLPASASTLSAFAAAGWHCESEVVAGPAFWQTVEIEAAPALVAASARIFERSLA